MPTGSLPGWRALRLPLACAVLAALAAGFLYADGPAGVDAPAHLFQTWLYRTSGFELWNNYWYAGRYEFVSYSPLYYPLAALVGQAPVIGASAAVMAGAFAAVSRREWGRAALGPSLALSLSVPFVAAASGAYPFLAGAAAATVALGCVQRRWRAGFAVATITTLGFSPLAFALLVPLLAGFLLGSGRPRATLARHRATLATVLAVFVAGALLQRAFPSGGWYPYDLTDALIVAGFSLAGLYVTGSSPRARSLRMLFAAYLALNLVAFFLQGPIGSNTNRLFAIAGAPLLWLAANVSRERSRLVVVPLLATAVGLQIGPFVRDAYSSWRNPAASAAFWRAPAAFIEAHADPQHRVEVVATWGHWEAYYLAKRGIPLARGWFRQDDFPLNQPLYDGHLTASAYRRWLERLGVQYVVLPQAPLDYSSAQEAALLRSGRSGLVPAGGGPNFQAWRLRDPAPLVSAPSGARASLVSLARGRVQIRTSAPGRYLVRVRYSPYWSASPRATCVTPTADGMTSISTPTGGYVLLRLQPQIESVARTLAAAPERC